MSLVILTMSSMARAQQFVSLAPASARSRPLVTPSRSIVPRYTTQPTYYYPVAQTSYPSGYYQASNTAQYYPTMYTTPYYQVAYTTQSYQGAYAPQVPLAQPATVSGAAPVAPATATPEVQPTTAAEAPSSAPVTGTGDPYGFTAWLNATRAAYGLAPVGH